MRLTEPCGTDISDGMVRVHYSIQRRRTTAQEVSAVRPALGTNGQQRHAVRAQRVRREHDREVLRPLGVRRPGEHHRHGGTCMTKRRSRCPRSIRNRMYVLCMLTIPVARVPGTVTFAGRNR